MNFYKHHLGDYAAATSHLSWDEDCAYRRLLDGYYKREAAIPADVKDACRLVRASTPVQRRCVQAVLSEFFTLLPDGWHQKRCDEEIGAATAQAETNRRIAEKREADKRARIEHESLTRKANESLHESSTLSIGEREPSQTPDSRHQTPDSRKRKEKAKPLDRPSDVTEQTWLDWLQLRKGKRAAVTGTVLEEARKEAGKAGVPLERFLRIWCSRGSQGLQADWLKPHERVQATDSGYGYESPADKAKRERVHELTGGLASRKPSRTSESTDPPETIDVAARLVG